MANNETNMAPEQVVGLLNDGAARIWNQERFKDEVAQAIFELMEQQGVKRSELADRLGVSKPRVTQFLGGSHNFTLETLADVFMALGRSAHIWLDTNPKSLAAMEDRTTALREPYKILHRESSSGEFVSLDLNALVGVNHHKAQAA